VNSLLETLRKLGPARLGLMGAVAAGSIAFFIFLTSHLNQPGMSLLYADLTPQDSGQIVSRLEQMDVPFRLGADGRQIYVPSDQVPRLRIAMAQDGLPTGGSIGYEIFDRSEGLGTTNFVQNVNHVRALEGELARTIRSINGVRQARVHLVLPKRELFTRERTEPTASIVIAMTGNRELDRRQVMAIQNLVAAAVPGLKPSMVSIIDSNGNLLARTTREGDLEATANTAEEMRIGFETRMVRTIEELLARSLGPGNVRAQVSAEMDFDRITENSEVYDPDGQVVRSTQTVEEQQNSVDATGEAPVTLGGNLPDAQLPGTGAGSQNTAIRNEETVNYEISRTVKTHVRETGIVRRLSIAVLVNGTTKVNADGTTEYQPRSPEEMDQIAALVRSAVGFDEARGDTLEVVNLPFVDPAKDLVDAEGGSMFGLDQAQLMRIAEVLVLGVVAVLVLLLVVRPLVGRIMEGPIDDEAAPQRLTTGEAGARAALTGPATATAGALTAAEAEDDAPDVVAEEIEHMIDINKVEGRVRASSIRKIGEIVDKHPDEAVAIIRSWLYQET